MRIHIGTSGYVYRHWKNIFYPEKMKQTQLEHYSSFFDTVEINATFYSNFEKRVYSSWSKQTKENFVFSIKGPRYITHVRRLKDIRDEVKSFFEKAKGLDGKLKVVLWQFPPSFKKSDENELRLENFISFSPKIWQALEFRHVSWTETPAFIPDNFSYVINSSTRYPLITPSNNSQFIYIRFHGPKSLYTSSYSDLELSHWSEKIRKMAKEREVFCYFNNDARGYAVKNALFLKKKLSV